MKFYEKLIILRKKALLSQEELAEKLDVTRQTISKWELGQSKPDIDKLQMMSKLFEVDVNTLTNEDISLEDKGETKEDKNNKKEDGENYSYIDDFSTFLKENMNTSEEIMICGGANIYRQALPYCKKLCISKVNSVHDCDTFFPDFNESDYKLINTIKYTDFTYYEYESVII